jgi:hypothetical protein
MISDNELQRIKIIPGREGKELLNCIKEVNYLGLKPLEVADVTKARRVVEDKELKKKIREGSGWVPNSRVYTLDDDGVMVHIPPADLDPVFNNPEEACYELGAWVTKGNYFMRNKDSVDAIANDERVLHILYSGIELIGRKDYEHGHLVVQTANPPTLETWEGKIARKHFARTEREFHGNMKMFSDSGIENITEEFLMENYILNALAEQKDAKALVRTCWLKSFKFNSDLVDGKNYVNQDTGHIFVLGPVIHKKEILEPSYRPKWRDNPFYNR